jgi:cation diffusion facilitator family transporter
VSSEDSPRAVAVALAANLGIAASKFVAFAVTGSASMLAEGVHSVADSGNQVLLLVGRNRAKRDATAAHPFGFGRERFVYGFLVSVILFSVGGLFALYEGAQKLVHPHKVDEWYWAIGVLLFAVVLESTSLRTAVRESNRVRRGLSWPSFIRRATIPELPIVLLEDFGALAGLGFALFGVGLAVLTDNGRWDGVGTLGIGLLLVAIASVLAVEMKSLLIGEGVGPQERIAIERALVDDERVTRVIHLRTQYLGPDELLVAAKIAVRHDDTAADVARAIDAAEVRLRAAVPAAKLVYLEPDIYRGDVANGASADRSDAGDRRDDGDGDP